MKAIILGAGESGIGAALLAKQKGYNVFVSDNGPVKENYKSVLLNNDIDFEEGNHTWEKISSADIIIKSPGIPEKAEIIKHSRKDGIKIISEIEFAAGFTTALLVCITGSNGKTTTTNLTWHILKNAGLNAGMAGNVGSSFALSVARDDFDVYVLEISSFQLDDIQAFRPDIAVITNITPDHLDRYEYDFNRYAASKFRLIMNQGPEDALIYNTDDEVVLAGISKWKPRARMYPFSIIKELNSEGAYIKEKQMIVNINQIQFAMTLENLALQGKHNIYNSMAAGIAARVLDIKKDTIKSSLSDFQNIEHRLEYVARIHGVDFINDSKATNVNSTWYALESIDRPIVWIAGGIDKGNNYQILKPLVKQKVVAMICLGLDNSKLRKAFDGDVETIIETVSMDEAVNYALYFGKSNSTVLLSPSCASFDLFANFEERGKKFKEAVWRL